jgi:hypothetical protein
MARRRHPSGFVFEFPIHGMSEKVMGMSMPALHTQVICHPSLQVSKYES